MAIIEFRLSGRDFVRTVIMNSDYDSLVRNREAKMASDLIPHQFFINVLDMN